MIDIERIVQFATVQGYHISDLYKVLGMSKSTFVNIRKNIKEEFKISYFYKLCNYLGIDIEEGIIIFDRNSSIDFNEYIPEYDRKILTNKFIKIDELIKYANGKGIYMKDLASYLGLEVVEFKSIKNQKSQSKLKDCFFDLCSYIGIPYGKALSKYTTEICN